MINALVTLLGLLALQVEAGELRGSSPAIKDVGKERVEGPERQLESSEPWVCVDVPAGMPNFWQTCGGGMSDFRVDDENMWRYANRDFQMGLSGPADACLGPCWCCRQWTGVPRSTSFVGMTVSQMEQMDTLDASGNPMPWREWCNAVSLSYLPQPAGDFLYELGQGVLGA
eukprot:CAMPEP_0178397016 /NCGR_PEP_ID=MMETSP0689_2-20121128/14027_1 /TAXON_ID=160604 /ORGANISM="Amphidinium massartii, Strain CS-259" /LENGTH=170 /DNA_ID=CAMNT_0020017709 /DNA_START=104 /DNA_END=613 /DNA_ORIENTATION=+